MTTSKPSMDEKNFFNGSGPTTEAEQKDSSATTMQDNISKPATNNSTSEGPQPKLQETPPNPQNPTQEETLQIDKQRPEPNEPT